MSARPTVCAPSAARLSLDKLHVVGIDPGKRELIDVEHLADAPRAHEHIEAMGREFPVP